MVDFLAEVVDGKDAAVPHSPKCLGVQSETRHTWSVPQLGHQVVRDFLVWQNCRSHVPYGRSHAQKALLFYLIALLLHLCPYQLLRLR